MLMKPGTEAVVVWIQGSSDMKWWAGLTASAID